LNKANKNFGFKEIAENKTITLKKITGKIRRRNDIFAKKT